MAIKNTNTSPLLKDGNNITLTQSGQVITISATDTTNAPGGSNTQVQFNDSGVFGGDAGLTYNKTTNVLSAESVDFAVTPTAADAERRLHWDNDEGSLVLTLKGGNLTIPIGAEVVSLCYNAEATTLTKGTVVYVFGAQGQRISVKRAVNTGDSTSAQTIGVVAESIASGAEGWVMVQGMIRGLDTSAYTQGDALYLSATAGQFTKTKPYAPNHLVYVGFVVKVNMSSGEIFVKCQNGYEMDELHNVSAQSPSNNDILAYNTSTNLWEKKQITVIGGVTGSGTTNELTYWTGTNAIGALSTATYPSLTELSYVKGVTSSIQTQLNGKQNTLTNPVTGTGSSGQVAYFNGTTSITSESNLFWDATNDRLGIGTASPTYSLDVVTTGQSVIQIKAGTTTDDSILVFGDSAANAVGRIYYSHAIDGMLFYTNSTEKMRITSGGNVLINTTTDSGYKLDVNGSGRFSDRLLLTKAVNNNYLSFDHAGTQTWHVKITNTNNSSFLISNDYSGGRDILSLTETGNLGLGVSPTVKLQVETPSSGNGVIFRYTGGTNNPGLFVQTEESTKYVKLLASGSVTSGQLLQLGVNSASVSIDTSGNLGLGVTPSAWSSGFTAIQLGAQGVNLSATNTSTSNLYLSSNGYYDGTNWKAINSSTSGQYRITGNEHSWYTGAFVSSGSNITFTQAMTLTANGDLIIGSGADTGESLQVQGDLKVSMNTTNPVATFTNLNTAGTGNGVLIQLNSVLGSDNYILKLVSNVADRFIFKENGQLRLNDYTTTTSFTGTAVGYLGFTSSGDIITTTGSGLGGSTGSTDNAILRADGTGGSTVQSSAVTINDSGNMTLGLSSTTVGDRVINPDGNGSNVNIVLKGKGTGYAGLEDVSTGNNRVRVTNTYALLQQNNAYVLCENDLTTIRKTSSSTNTVIESLVIQSASSGSPASGIGTALSLSTETGPDVYYTGSIIESVSTTLSGATFDLVFKTMDNGATANEKMRIKSTGEVWIANTTDQGAYNLQVGGTGVWGAGAYVNGSDRRLKENIKPIETALDLVTKLKPVSFNYIPSFSKDTTTQSGFIAQDLIDTFQYESYLDGLVSKGDEYYNVAYQNLIPVLTKAIQELKQEIEILKAKIN